MNIKVAAFTVSEKYINTVHVYYLKGHMVVSEIPQSHIAAQPMIQHRKEHNTNSYEDIRQTFKVKQPALSSSSR